MNLGQNDKSIILNAINNMMLELQARGEHASGICAIDNDKQLIIKAPLKAADFLKAEYYTKFMDEHWNSKVILVHCRHATQGEPTKNFNNHPLASGRYITTHNGMIRDDAEKVFNLLIGDWDRKIETDSYLLNKVAEVYGFYAVPSIDGSIATIAYDITEKKLILFRNTEHNSLHAGYCEDLKLLVFASTKDAVEEAFKKKKTLFGIIKIEEEEADSKTNEIDKDVIYETGINDIGFTKTFKKLGFRAVDMESRLNDYYDVIIIPVQDDRYIVYFSDSIKQKIKEEFEMKKIEKKNEHIFIVDRNQFEAMVSIVEKNKDKKVTGYRNTYPNSTNVNMFNKLYYG